MLAEENESTKAWIKQNLATYISFAENLRYDSSKRQTSRNHIDQSSKISQPSPKTKELQSTLSYLVFTQDPLSYSYFPIHADFSLSQAITADETKNKSEASQLYLQLFEFLSLA